MILWRWRMRRSAGATRTIRQFEGAVNPGTLGGVWWQAVHEGREVAKRVPHL